MMRLYINWASSQKSNTTKEKKKKMFKKYGKFVGIDFTYNLIKETPFGEEEIMEERQIREQELI